MNKDNCCPQPPSLDQERRKHSRIHQQLECNYTIFSDMIIPNIAKLNRGLIHNLSVAGALVEIPDIPTVWLEAIAKGIIKIGMEFKLLGTDFTCRAIGQAVWRMACTTVEHGATCKLGVNFIDITSTSRDAITDYVLDFFLPPQE